MELYGITWTIGRIRARAKTSITLKFILALGKQCSECTFFAFLSALLGSSNHRISLRWNLYLALSTDALRFSQATFCELGRWTLNYQVTSTNGSAGLRTAGPVEMIHQVKVSQ